MASLAEQLDSLPVLDSLTGYYSPLKQPPWVKAPEVTEIGYLENAWGYFMEPASGNTTGALWGEDALPTNSAVAVELRLETSEERYFEIWSHLGEAVKTGWRLAAIRTAAGTYTIKLELWLEGAPAGGEFTQEVTGVKIDPNAVGGKIALVILDSEVRAFVKQNSESEWVEQLSYPEAYIELLESTYGAEPWGGIGTDGHWYPSLYNFALGEVVSEEGKPTGTLLAEMPVTDTLKHGTMPGEGEWPKLPWANSRGSDSESGWKPPGYSEWTAGSRGGWYWAASQVTGGNGATILQRSGTFGHLNLRQFAVWLFSEAGATPSGYQLVAWQTGTTDQYTFKLRKWVEGSETPLGETAAVAMESTGSFAIVKRNGKVSAWVKKNSGSEWALVGSEVEDSKWTSGYSGVDGNGSNPTLINFATGKLESGTSPANLSLGASSGGASATLAVTAKTGIPLNPAEGAASATLDAHVPTRIALGAATGVASPTLALSTKIALPLAASQGVAVTSIVVGSGLQMPLAPSEGVASPTLIVDRPVKPGRFVKWEDEWVEL